MEFKFKCIKRLRFKKLFSLEFLEFGLVFFIIFGFLHLFEIMKSKAGLFMNSDRICRISMSYANFCNLDLGWREPSRGAESIRPS
jgi:hypothetical protein